MITKNDQLIRVKNSANDIETFTESLTAHSDDS
jgi:hypothetical protein